jgi:hypothetical protein
MVIMRVVEIGCLFHLSLMCWIIWGERNGRTFEGVELSLISIKYLCWRTSYDWMSSLAMFVPLL